MTQTCSLLQLLLVDLRDLEREEVRDLLQRVADRGVLRGAVGTDSSAPQARAVLAANVDLLDFWFIGESGDWPFSRALSFSGVEPARAAFISADTETRALGDAAGFMSSAPDSDAIERLLP